jgi:hypothetical protein
MSKEKRFRWTCLLSSLLSGRSFGADAGDCTRALAGLGKLVALPMCSASTDLTTANPQTTPADNSIPNLPPGAFTPRADALNVPSVAPAGRYPITKAVPGLQIAGTMASNNGARWVLRLPDQWNGRLVVAVAPGVSSEYSSDIIMSDYAVQNGYAYASTNKGHFARRPSTADDPLACLASPPGGPGANTFTYGYQADLQPNEAYATWFKSTLDTTRLAKNAIIARYGRQPAFTYLTGRSSGALTARRLLETDPEEFDAGIEWAAPYIAAIGNPRQSTAPLYNGASGAFAVGMKNFPEYRASGYNQRSEALEVLQSVGIPPDIFGSPTANSSRGSWLETHYNLVWMGLQCGNVRLNDPSYTGAIADYKYWERIHDFHPEKYLDAISTTGNVQRPLISVHGTMDATAWIIGSRLYRADVIAQGRSGLHRLYEIQNAAHRDTYRDPPENFAEIEPILPHYVEAFEALVRWVESGSTAPQSQCVARGGRLVNDPPAGRCPSLLVQ